MTPAQPAIPNDTAHLTVGKLSVLLVALAMTMPVAAAVAATGTTPGPAGDALMLPASHEAVQVAPAFAGQFYIQPLIAETAPTALEFGPGDGDGPDLYASTLTGEIHRYHLLWTPVAPVVQQVSVVADGFNLPLGLVFDEAGNLYIADSYQSETAERPVAEILRIDADTGDQDVIVDGVPNGQHNINNLRFGPDGLLYMPNGNPNDHGNGTGTGHTDIFPITGAFLVADVNGVDPDLPDTTPASPAVLHWEDENGDEIEDDDLLDHPRNQDFLAKIHVFAHGFRNIYDIAFAPSHLPFAGAAFTGMNGADGPASQDSFYKIRPGQHHGYPFCYNVGPPGGTGEEVEKVQAPNTPNPAVTCEDKVPADALLGWHTCATGTDLPRLAQDGLPQATFPAGFHQAAYVGECSVFSAGDWLDRMQEEPSTHSTSHKVVQVPLDDQGVATDVVDFITGLALPTDVHFGPDGAMYISDAGAIYRVAPHPTGPLAGPAAIDQPVPVAAVGQSFVSQVTVVPKGTPVAWTSGPLVHTVTTSDELCTPHVDASTCTPNDVANRDGDENTFNRLLPGFSTIQHTFTEAGVFPYYCGLHADLGMIGLVVVIDPEDPGALGPAGLSDVLAFAGELEDQHVHAGGHGHGGGDGHHGGAGGLVPGGGI